jgi:large subunit ribosomal protein L18
MQGLVLKQYEFRRARVRNKISQLHHVRPRLSVCRTLKHIYAQVIDDTHGKTLAHASSMSPELKSHLKLGGNRKAAEAVGKLIGEKAIAQGVKAVVFDRGGHAYHGRIQALAEAARKAGLEF